MPRAASSRGGSHPRGGGGGARLHSRASVRATPLLACALLLASSAEGAEPKGFSFYTGTRLIETCKAEVLRPEEDEELSDAALRGPARQLSRAEPSGDRTAVVPAQTWPGQLRPRVSRPTSM